ncbi:hypothetical protein K9O30_15765 [Clostridium bowmanii]|uniref:hypothetical protein n=1 Tax=Clostridium bowmanii TaxID=132925 RepID=UPI001C0B1CA8|nr:hypothetical protein [Clostridium bowmanii]MBU3190623.1 hypothetical protein [Clostridium bowmanii]MCA1075156.1 hypothetical protein [Clostridium bowmanii]
MKDVLELIDVVEENIVEYDMKKFKETVAVLVEKIFYILPKLDEKYIKHINIIFQNINVALNNKDYLLYQDILEFELKPILKNARMS